MRVCVGCGDEFLAQPSEKKRYCSQPCWLRRFNQPGAAHSRNGAKKGGATMIKRMRGTGTTPGAYTKEHGQAQHRVVAERHLGRPLRPKEVVHHEDRNSRNNDPANLWVFPDQAEHVRHHAHQRYHPEEVCTCSCLLIKKLMSAS